MDNLRFTKLFIDLPTIYKVSKTRKVQKWKIYLELLDDKGIPIPINFKKNEKKKLPATWSTLITTVWGVDKGKEQTAELEIEEGKNIGQANETNVLTQGISEMLSIWTHKIERKGYTRDLTAAPTIIRPMLLHKYTKASHKIDFTDSFLQEKLDGVRCIAHYNPTTKQIELISRTGLAFNHLNHIRAALANIPPFIANPTLYLDGELYARNIKFEDIVGLVRHKTMSDENKPLEKNIRLHIFDSFDTSHPEEPFTERIKRVYSMLSPSVLNNPGIVAVPTERVRSDLEVNQKYKAILKSGGEGAVIRNGQGKYQIDTRSFDTLKLKNVDSDEFEIIGFTDGRGKERGQIIFRLKTKEGAEFNAPPNNTVEERKKMFLNGDSFIGKFATVQFMAYTKAGKVPRFPKVIVIRDYE